MAMATASRPLDRHCLVTVGATVGFARLTQQVVEPAFWHSLRRRGFTALHVQCGPDAPWARARLAQLDAERPAGLDVVVFGVKSNLVRDDMSLCKAVEGRRARGLVISHAGTGTILDAWKLGVPLVVVPNTALLDDHQTQMAQHLAQEGYATMASPNRDDLHEAIHKAELLSQDNRSRWPPNSVAPQRAAALRLWHMVPSEVKREERAQMSHD